MALLKFVYYATLFLYVATVLTLSVLSILGARIGGNSLYVIVGIIDGFFLLLLAISLFLFIRSNSIAGRSVALLLIALPLVAAGSYAGVWEVRQRMNTDKAGHEAYMPAGPLRDIEAAIFLNDAATVAALAPKVDLNTLGTNGQTLLVNALNQLEKTWDRLEVLRILLKDGANPNLGPQELPLKIAIRLSYRTGPEPLKMLLGAGADPNAKDSFGTPAYFLAAGMATPDILQLLLDHGADINAKGYRGLPVIFAAAEQRNWKVVIFLYERGVNWKKSEYDGLSFQSYVEREGAGSSESDRAFYRQVLEHVRQH